MIISVFPGFFVADRNVATRIVGRAVNLNLIVFFVSPLQIIQPAVQSADSSRIHRPTMSVNFAHAFFWFLYWFAKRLAQMVLCLCYPKRNQSDVGQQLEPLLHLQTAGSPHQAEESSGAVIIV